MRSDHPSMRGHRLAGRVVADGRGHGTVYVSGCLDRETAPSLRAAVGTALAAHPALTTLVVDLEAAWQVDALAALATLLGLARTARARGVTLRVAHASEPLRRTLLETCANGVPVGIAHRGFVYLSP